MQDNCEHVTYFVPARTALISDLSVQDGGMDGPSTPRSQRSNRQMPTPSSGVNPPSSSAGNPYVVPSDFRGRDAASNSNRSGGNSVTVTVPVSSTANINTQSSSNKATLETMAKNIADNTACLQGILKELKQMSDAINEQTRRSFSIEHSSYKVNKHPQSAPTRTQAFTSAHTLTNTAHK